MDGEVSQLCTPYSTFYMSIVGFGLGFALTTTEHLVGLLQRDWNMVLSLLQVSSRARFALLPLAYGVTATEEVLFGFDLGGR